MTTDIDSGEAAEVPCPVCGADDALIFVGDRHDDPFWVQLVRRLVGSPRVTGVYVCAVCDEVVVIPDRTRGGRPAPP